MSPAQKTKSGSKPQKTKSEPASKSSPASGGAHFSPSLFKFLAALKRNNNREWFGERKAQYEAEVRDPALQFIADFGPRLDEISRCFVADPRPVGGSLMRVYRDTRFAKDKTPYKTMVGIQFRHQAGKDVHAPGFYLHLEPGEVFVGVGLWQPETKVAAQIREAIVEAPERWTAATRSKSFLKDHALGGESLKRPPQGMDPAHPLMEDLKRKSYIAVRTLSEAEACQPGFIDQIEASWKATAPLMKFLTEAMELPF